MEENTMTCYIHHHIPGRLRVKIPALKKNAAAARHAKVSIDAIHGVLETEINDLTCSVVVKYDTGLVSSTRILDALREQGYVQTTHPDSARYAAPAAQSTQKLADVLMTKMVETLVERSAIALISAVI